MELLMEQISSKQNKVIKDLKKLSTHKGRKKIVNM